MAANPGVNEARADNDGRSPSPEYVAAGLPSNPLAAAALVGGVLAAGAGAYVGARAMARRNGASDGKPVSSVMANAITATDVKPE